ncbi:MAG TPA: hypothetical protein VKP65_10345 [Rhodothermales bacterium]|nr:hypothetical protein [Rhodothermales bacterium]
MTKLEDRLSTIAHMMDGLPGYTSHEVLVWQNLIQHVDRACFERTGRIVAANVSLHDLADALGTKTMMHALEHLAERGHLIIEPDTADRSIRYRLFLSSQTPANQGSNL